MAKAKILVVGLDSGTWRLMRPWMQEGRLPEISRLVESGASGILNSVIPPVTATAWTSFVTGKSPGRHGLFSFMKRRPGTYEMMPNSGLDIRGETLADILSRHGRRVALVNLPMLYPPRPTNGIIIAGLDTPSVKSCFTFPKELQDELLKRFNYEIEITAPLREGYEHSFREQVTRIETKRAEAAQYLLGQGNWDLFTVLFRGTDLLSHYFWRAQDPSHPGYDSQFAEKFGHVLREHYQQMDGVIGRLLRAAGDDCTIIIMSDHGSGPIRRHVYLDNWLLKQGFMKVKRSQSARMRYFLLERGLTISNIWQFLIKIGVWRWVRRFVRREARLKVAGQLFGSTSVDWANTQAYPVGVVGAISINLKGREPLGAVSPGAEYEQVRQRIQEELLELCDPDTGEHLVSRVLRKEDVYNGPCLEDAPDLIIVWQRHEYNSTFVLGGSNKIVSPLLKRYSGTHTMDGILLISGPGIRPGLTVDNAEIIDVAPTILALLGLPIPDDMDGKVLTQVAERDLETQYESAGQVGPTIGQDVFSLEEEQLMTERLRNLGYI